MRAKECMLHAGRFAFYNGLCAFINVSALVFISYFTEYHRWLVE